MKYRVFNTIENRYVTDEKDWVLKPNGRLAVNEYGDEIGYPHCIVEFVFDCKCENGEILEVIVYDN